jgi:putative tricarboxylic transport membrane protein
MTEAKTDKAVQAAVGGGALLLGLAMGAGAISIPGAAGYGGAGPNFLPWLVAVALMLCGAWLLWQALRGGYRDMAPPSGAVHGDWRALGWVAAGVLANAALITRVGFILSCTLCFALAVRGLRGAEGRPASGLRQFAVDVLTGVAIAAPVYWLFTKVLAINLPGLTGTGWL